MRDPKRIEPMLANLRILWERWPDQRLGQLIANIARPVSRVGDVFNVEDDEMARLIQEQIDAKP